MKKFKIVNISQAHFLTHVSHCDIAAEYEIIESASHELDDLLKLAPDVIEFDPAEYDAIKPQISSVEWRTNLIGVADSLVKTKSGRYQPQNLLVKSIVELIKKNSGKINSQQPVMVVGDEHFVLSVTTYLAMSGFVEIICSITTDAAESSMLAEKIEKKIKSFVFDLKLKFINVNELTTSDIVCALLVADFKRDESKEAYELLAYFNFLSQGSLFIDCNSIKDPYLVDDAKKAEIAVIDELAVIEQKYESLLEILKNSP